MQKNLATSEELLFFLSALIEVVVVVKEAAQPWKWICCTRTCYNCFAHWIATENSVVKMAVSHHSTEGKGIRNIFLLICHLVIRYIAVMTNVIIFHCSLQKNSFDHA